MQGVTFSVEHREAYTVVRVQGDPTLAQFLAFIAEVGLLSRGWPTPRALFDLRSVRTLTGLPEHQAVGGAAAAQLGHMARVASVVPADRMTRGSERAARVAGLQLSVFTTEADAIDWLMAG